MPATRHDDMPPSRSVGPPPQRCAPGPAPASPPPVKTVSVIAQKGGAGKTTLSLSLACAAAAEGLSAVVVDLDPQASAASWGDRRESDTPAVVPAQAPRLARILDAAAGQGVALAVVDTAPRAEQGAVAAARAADLVLVPCRPAVYDVETVAGTRDLVAAVAPRTPLLCVLNAVPPRALLADFGVPVAAPSLGQRAAVDYAAAAGHSAAEHDPRGRAAAEIAALWSAVGELTGLTPAHPESRDGAFD